MRRRRADHLRDRRRARSGLQVLALRPAGPQSRDRDLRATHRQAPDSRIPARQRSSDASLRQRLEAANARLRQLAEENRTLREQLARALGEQRSATSPRPPRTGPNSSRSVTIGPC